MVTSCSVFIVGDASSSKLACILDRLKTEGSPDVSVAGIGTPGKITAGEADDMNNLIGRCDTILFAGGHDRQAMTTTLQIERQTALRWIHNLGTGMDSVWCEELSLVKCPVTNGRGASAVSLAEWVMMATLHFIKDVPRLVNDKHERRWDKTCPPRTLRGLRMAIVGFGAIGRETARLAKAFGMEVVAVRSAANIEEIVDEGAVQYGSERLYEALDAADVVVVALPLTPTTHHLISDTAIARMKSTAIVINVGRGATVDEAALAEALQNQRIGGVAVDVWAEEPPTPDHPFYTLENALVSPHNADDCKLTLDTAVDIFLSNAERFRAGKDLLNVVTLEKRF